MSRGRVRVPGVGSRNASRASKTLRITALLGAVGTMVLTACGGTVTGHATSPLTDPFRAGGLPVVDGPSGPRADAPSPTGTLEGTDGGEIDHVALLSVNDIEDFWSKSYGPPLKGTFSPVEEIHSYDASDPLGPTICGESTYKLVNAFYCNRDRLIAWDRGKLLPLGQKFFGDMAITGVLAHEYGHAIQYMADLVDRRTPTIVAEQQADCFAGSYMRWVAEGNSPRFTLSTADGLNLVLAGLLTLRDPIITPEKTEMLEEGHGTAFERISAFQMGFVTGTTACAGIDLEEIENRRGDLPEALGVDEKTGGVQTGELPVTEKSVTALVDTLNEVFAPNQAPTLSFNGEQCADANATPPASYCPATNTISVELSALQEMGATADENDQTLIQGDNTAYSVVMARYAQALQHERGLTLDSAESALRTACLTGAANRRLAEPVKTTSGNSVSITAGDLDEAVAGLLTNGMAATDVDGNTVKAGFARIDAFRSGVLGDDQRCYQRYP